MAATEPQMEQTGGGWRDPLWRRKKDDVRVYPVTRHSRRNRVALLITNIHFTNENLNRNGAETDEETMRELLRVLGYEVVKHRNLTGKAIDEAVVNFSKHPKLKETDSVLVVISSHGRLGAVLGVDCKHEQEDEFPINNIYKHLGSEECPALLNKPKILVIQAGRPVRGGSVPVGEDAADSDLVTHPGASLTTAEEDTGDDTMKYVHKEKDFISLLFCADDHVSYRQKGRGSFFIRLVFEIFSEYAREDHIEELFRKVMQSFDESSIQSGLMPATERSTLTKCFYFFPDQSSHSGGPSFGISGSTSSIRPCSPSMTLPVVGSLGPEKRHTVLQYSTASELPDAFMLSGEWGETEASVRALPACSHIQSSSDPFGSSRDSSCLPHSHDDPSLSPPTSAENKTSTGAESLPDMLRNNSFEEFTPDITDDGSDESYRFQCSCPGLYQCSETGLVFHMEAGGDVVYRTVPWNRRLLAQHHKRPAGPLFDIECPQQSVCQLHLPHCEIRSTGGCQFLSVVHVNDAGIEFISPHKITETHVVINVTGFSAYGNVKDEDAPPVPVRALVLLFYRPPAAPHPTSLLNVLMLPRNVVLRDVQRIRKEQNKSVRDVYIETSLHCKLHAQQEYTLFTCPEDDSVQVQPKEAEFECDNYDNYFPSFQVTLKTIITDLKLLLKGMDPSVTVWEREVFLSCGGVKRKGDSPERLREIRRSFIDGVSGPVLKSLLDKLFEKDVLADSERETADSIQDRSDKARFVIDTVRKKGEAASSEMIEFLCEVDPFLCEHLGLI